jgi:hypothetical protein
MDKEEFKRMRIVEGIAVAIILGALIGIFFTGLTF